MATELSGTADRASQTCNSDNQYLRGRAHSAGRPLGRPAPRERSSASLGRSSSSGLLDGRQLPGAIAQDGDLGLVGCEAGDVHVLPADHKVDVSA
jgi:hypothetical protein